MEKAENLIVISRLKADRMRIQPARSRIVRRAFRIIMLVVRHRHVKLGGQYIGIAIRIPFQRLPGGVFQHFLRLFRMQTGNGRPDSSFHRAGRNQRIQHLCLFTDCLIPGNKGRGYSEVSTCIRKEHQYRRRGAVNGNLPDPPAADRVRHGISSLAGAVVISYKQHGIIK